MTVSIASKHEEQLQQTVLGWDYFDLQRKAKKGVGPNPSLTKVPDTFENLDEYLAVFGPLVKEECAAQLLNSGGQDDAEQTMDHACVVSLVERKQGKQQGTYRVARLTVGEHVTNVFSKLDVVLLTQLPTKDTKQAKHALGIVDGHEGEQSIRVRFCFTRATNQADRTRLASVNDALVEKSKWYVSKCASLATVQREWAALQQVGQLPFLSTLLHAEPCTTRHTQFEISPKLDTALHTQYNISQQNAIKAGLHGDGVVLIQGPPGTGKTNTILGLLSIITQAAPQGVYSGTTHGNSDHLLQHNPAKRMEIVHAASPWLAGGTAARDVARKIDMLTHTRAGGHVFGLQAPARVRHIAWDGRDRPHVLVCAPSNSALDELVWRLLQGGLLDADGLPCMPSIVRCGVGKNIHERVNHVSLETLVAQKRGLASATHGARPSTNADERMRQTILNDAGIVCTTLSFAGSGVLSHIDRPFDVVVVDEAAQAVEPSLLVPLQFGAKQVFLVGDPVQLPATVISTRAVQHAYDKSLFRRLQKAGYPIQILDTQYRMHPTIAAFPSLAFYNNTLLTATDVLGQTTRAWHKHKLFGPLSVLDVQGQEQQNQANSSLYNMRQVEMVLLLCSELFRVYPTLKDSDAIGVVSPYKAQVRLVKQKLVDSLGDENARKIEVGTIDGFQGREKEIIIFTTVRSNTRSVGFVADERRINVGLTRARCSLIVLANCKALKRDQVWGKLLSHARDIGCMYETRNPLRSFLKSVLQGDIKPEPARGDIAEDMELDADCYSE